MRLPTFTEYAPATVVRAREAAREQAMIEIDPPPGFTAGYARPGQFCKIRIAGVEGIFAMYSAPKEEGARFLVRVGNPEGGEAADALAVSADGTPIEMTLPAGEGFPIHQARGRNVYFVATGTGIAPVRAAIETVVRDREWFGALSLDHGVRSEAHLAIGEEIARWRAAGIDVHVHMSTPEADGVVGVTVQDALRARKPDLADAAIIAVGQGEMLASLLEEITLLGGDPDLFLKNI